MQPVGRPCGSWMHDALRDVRDMGQQMGYCGLEWTWPKEAMILSDDDRCVFAVFLRLSYLFSVPQGEGGY